VLGARVVSVERIERAREEPGAVLERLALGIVAGEPPVLLPRVVVDEQFDAAPVAAIARQHLAERVRVRTVGRRVPAEQVQRESAENVAPPAADLALLRGGVCAVQPPRISEITNTLLDSPSLGRRMNGGRVEHRDQIVAEPLDRHRLQWRRRSLLIVPIADVAHLLVALCGPAASRARQAVEMHPLEIGLRAAHRYDADR